MIKTLTALEIHTAIVPAIKNGVSHIEAIIAYAKQNDLEIEAIAEILKKSPIIKQKIRDEAELLRLLKPEAENPSL